MYNSMQRAKKFKTGNNFIIQYSYCFATVTVGWQRSYFFIIRGDSVETRTRTNIHVHPKKNYLTNSKYKHNFVYHHRWKTKPKNTIMWRNSKTNLIKIWSEIRSRTIAKAYRRGERIFKSFFSRLLEINQTLSATSKKRMIIC